NSASLPAAPPTAADEVGFTFDRGRARSLLQIRDCRERTERIGKGHDGAAMQNGRARTELGTNGHFADDLVLLGADAIDARKLGKGQGLRAQSCPQVHSSPPIS